MRKSARAQYTLEFKQEAVRLATDEGWLFLAVVIDLFSRKVVGWSLQEDMRRELVIDAFEMAWFQHLPTAAL